MIPFSFPRRFAALSLLAVLGGCTSSSEGGNPILNTIAFGAAGVPAPAAEPAIPPEDCPPVTVGDGGAALRAVGGGEGSVRSQIAIVNVARECAGRADGATLVKVGVQGRVLLGPGGTAGRFDAPVSIVLKRGEQVLGRRVVRSPVSIPPGQQEQSFVVVEDGFVVPAGTGEFEIEVSLGASGAATPKARRRG